jgi:hypothetical protein
VNQIVQLVQRINNAVSHCKRVSYFVRCAEANGVLSHVRPVFVPDPDDHQVIQTNYFPLPSMRSDVIFFHCCVKVCLSEENCGPVSHQIERRELRAGERCGPWGLGLLEIWSRARARSGFRLSLTFEALALLFLIEEFAITKSRYILSENLRQT